MSTNDNVIRFQSKKANESLVELMKRCQQEVFDDDVEVFERAYAEAIAQQILDLIEVNDGKNLDLSEELHDAMHGVLLQWLGDYPCCPRELLESCLAGH